MISRSDSAELDSPLGFKVTSLEGFNPFPVNMTREFNLLLRLFTEWSQSIYFPHYARDFMDQWHPQSNVSIDNSRNHNDDLWIHFRTRAILGVTVDEELTLVEARRVVETPETPGDCFAAQARRWTDNEDIPGDIPAVEITQLWDDQLFSAAMIACCIQQIDGGLATNMERYQYIYEHIKLLKERESSADLCRLLNADSYGGITLKTSH